jgi:hypothetical protein
VLEALIGPVRALTGDRVGEQRVHLDTIELSLGVLPNRADPVVAHELPSDDFAVTFRAIWR